METEGQHTRRFFGTVSVSNVDDAELQSCLSAMSAMDWTKAYQRLAYLSHLIVPSVAQGANTAHNSMVAFLIPHASTRPNSVILFYTS